MSVGRRKGREDCIEYMCAYNTYIDRRSHPIRCLGVSACVITWPIMPPVGAGSYRQVVLPSGCYYLRRIYTECSRDHIAPHASWEWGIPEQLIKCYDWHLVFSRKANRCVTLVLGYFLEIGNELLTHMGDDWLWKCNMTNLKQIQSCFFL